MHVSLSHRAARLRVLLGALLALAGPLGLMATPATAQEAAKAPGPGESLYNMAERASEQFPLEFLGNRDVIVYGRGVFLKRCTFCHVPVGHLGGHAPQLRPNALTADFIFERVTNGFRFMPAWGPLIEEKDRRALVAYLLSDPREY